jgi:hypothetical protein
MISGILKNEWDGTKPCNLFGEQDFPQANWCQYLIESLAGKRGFAQLFSGIAGAECFRYCADAGFWESSR